MLILLKLSRMGKIVTYNAGNTKCMPFCHSHRSISDGLHLYALDYSLIR